MAKVFSIRTPLQGELVDFMQESGFQCVHTAALVRDITCLLASYREEDIPLFPDVFVLPTVETLASLAPGTQRVVIGQNIEISSGAERILKDCASLAVKGWAVYVVKTAENAAEFGLFRAVMHSFATSAEEAMVEQDANVPCVLIRNRGHLVVELRNSKNITFTASFTSAPASESRFAQHVADFVSAVSSSIHEDKRKLFEQYLARALTDVLQHSHGTLLMAHTVPNDGNAPEPLQSGVWFATPIDLIGAYLTARDTNDAQALASLLAVEAILSGMIGSDGVVVFGTNGTVLGYRVFLKPTDEEKKHLPEKGGGRRRTFALMQRRLGVQLRAAFFRSQDGQTECQKAAQ